MVAYTVILSNRKTRTKDRFVSYRIVYSLKILKKKQPIKLSNLFQIITKNLNFGIKTDPIRSERQRAKNYFCYLLKQTYPLQLY